MCGNQDVLDVFRLWGCGLHSTVSALERRERGHGGPQMQIMLDVAAVRGADLDFGCALDRFLERAGHLAEEHNGEVVASCWWAG